MSNRHIFADTVFVLALINQRDQHHQRATEIAEKYGNYNLLITDAVLLEIGDAMARNFRQEVVEVIDRLITSDEVTVVHLTPQLFHSALVLYRSRSDKEWGLTDCVSFVVMKEAGVSAALTFDQHFVQSGFQALMRDDPYS